MTPQQRVVMGLMHRAGSFGVHNYEFARENILRYSARVDELREIGIKIKTVRISTGVFKYILERYLEEKPVKPNWQAKKKAEKVKEMEERGQGTLL